jgi:hypothetical protein
MLGWLWSAIFRFVCLLLINLGRDRIWKLVFFTIFYWWLILRGERLLLWVEVNLTWGRILLMTIINILLGMMIIWTLFVCHLSNTLLALMRILVAIQQRTKSCCLCRFSNICHTLLLSIWHLALFCLFFVLWPSFLRRGWLSISLYLKIFVLAHNLVWIACGGLPSLWKIAWPCTNWMNRF